MEAGPAHDPASCEVCGAKLRSVAIRRSRDSIASDAGSKERGRYTAFSQVPWYRRGDVNNLFVFLGMAGCLPLTAWTCWNLLTGDVYYNHLDEDGYLARWGIVNKLWAIGFAVIWIIIPIAVVAKIVSEGATRAN
jgi:hypothetical protein